MDKIFQYNVVKDTHQIYGITQIKVRKFKVKYIKLSSITLISKNSKSCKGNKDFK